MIISRRLVSSPGRVEKYRPPFMGFLRSKSNGGSISRSRSKGRSRASPLFVRRNKPAATVTQEPSSPKVTCMGQVRVKRSKPKIQPRSRENPTRRRCGWNRNASFCNGFAGKIKSSSFWSKWRMFALTCSHGEWKSDKLSESPISQPDRTAVDIREINEKEEKCKISKLLASTPPINAFLLTRSRSAPYNSSSLAFRFWEENNQRDAESRDDREQNVTLESTELEVPSEKMNGVNEPARSDGKEVELTESGFVRRPALKRSESAPARIGDEDEG